jgi:hypothetical protein
MQSLFLRSAAKPAEGLTNFQGKLNVGLTYWLGCGK